VDQESQGGQAIDDLLSLRCIFGKFGIDLVYDGGCDDSVST
jgi:hypothetical protein